MVHEFERVRCVPSVGVSRSSRLEYPVWIEMATFLDLVTDERLFSIVLSIAAVGVVFLAERLVRRVVTRFSRRIGLRKHLENLFKLVLRILIYSVGIIVVLEIWGLPTEWFLSVSALGGAAIGFASTQTLGNLLAGLYIMVSRPFEVNDYVKIGGSEGEVSEITLNYVKLYTPTYTTVEIPNSVVLNSTIQRYMSDGVIDYSFTMSLAGKVYEASWVSVADLFEEIVEPTLEEFWRRHGDVLPRRPEASLSEVAFLNRSVMVRVFFPKGQAKLLFDLLPELQMMILSRLDEYRAKA